MIDQSPLRLLIVEESENGAESLADILRNAGYSISHDHARDAEALEAALDAQIPDIVLCANRRDVITTESVQAILAQRKLSTPVIAIVEEAPEAAVVAAKKSGIAALVSYGQPEHLQLTVAHEITMLQLKNKVATLEAVLSDFENQNNTLIEDPGESDLDERLASMARMDSLTGLYNRQHFMTLLNKSIDTGENDGDARALIYITLDRFKELREEKGIATSDLVLCEIARILEKQCDSKDSIARFGGSSYTILYQASNSEKIQALGEKLLHDISAHMSEVNGQAITLTCSIGICAINEHSENAQKVLTHADTACEVARSSGGNQIHTHSAVIDERTSEAPEKEWDKVIKKTIDEERFYLAYQPIVSLSGDTSKRYEALLRIVDEEGHTILPGQFLEIAEKSGLSSEIDYWILETAFRNISELRKNGDEATVFLKLSRPVLADADLPAWVLGKLKEYQLASSSVVFQIQELNAANDLKSAITFVKAMNKLQCKVALEHFGRSNQPQILKHVPVDILKIDGTLIEGLAGSSEQQSRVKELIQLAHDSDKQCIAVCVENSATLAILWQYGVDFIQGNFVQEPDRKLAYDFEGEIA